VLGWVRPFEEHCDTVLRQVEEIRIESPIIRNDKEQGRLVHQHPRCLREGTPGCQDGQDNLDQVYLDN
jgi:hypothetical protein